MTALTITLIWLAIFLGVTLVMVSFLTRSYGDASALYKLYAVRDKLVGSVVFDGVERDGKFFDALYNNVNSLVAASKCLSGAEAWPIAAKAGKHLASRKCDASECDPLIPDDAMPEKLAPIIDDLNTALGYMLENHMGICILFSSKAREQRKIQKAKARHLQEMLTRNRHCTG